MCSLTLLFLRPGVNAQIPCYTVFWKSGSIKRIARTTMHERSEMGFIEITVDSLFLGWISYYMEPYLEHCNIRIKVYSCLETDNYYLAVYSIESTNGTWSLQQRYDQI